ncbi:hypothetical protein K504DRAFT_499891 [Pleomassaria siparia CBS 279.74]|uniref:Uncharacterized protein n=1 Tax=Pleomassaria siparia CBS 279.74 TaxID=1314801 RepID=A0A6G1KJ09_9PLEO|nr:hypothetical protein K504DRAFT_499891 [Pleomassaria siparia CBS 279.74]
MVSVSGSMIKWAEEGFTCSGDQTNGTILLDAAIEALKQCAECDYDGRVGVVAYDTDSWNRATTFLPETS